MRTRALFVVALIGVALCAACDEGSRAIKELGTSSSSSSSSGALPDGGEKDCFDNPTTHFQLINGCTNADRIDRRPTLSTLRPDGGLPPLP